MDQALVRWFIKYTKSSFSGTRLKVMILSVALCLIGILLFDGKTNIDLQAIAVSDDEQYVACYEDWKSGKIHCFHSDGSLAFSFQVTPEIRNGGPCLLWFENDVLCAFFSRTNKAVYFLLDGTILETANLTMAKSPTEFPGFAYADGRYTYWGSTIDVVYERRSFWEYWLWDKDRYLAIISPNGASRYVYSWTAKDGVVTNGLV